MPELTMVDRKCPRCGAVHEVDEDAEEFTLEDGCPDCESWEQCDKCGKWVESTDHVNDHGDWCESCVSDGAFCCEHCEEYHADEEAEEVIGRRGSTETWCRRCRSRSGVRCGCCGDWYGDDYWEGSPVDDVLICRDCLEDSGDYHYCEQCNEWRERECSSCSSGRFKARRGYGKHGSFQIVKLRSPIAIGMEMEVGEIGDLGNLDCEWSSFGERFAYPTEDGSLDDTGVEFIGHPWDAWKHLSEFDLYASFIQVLEDSGATLRTHASGCHMNVHWDAFGSDDAVRAAVVAVNRFRDALWLFTPTSTLERRQGYAKPVSFKDGSDPLSLISRTGKYSIANWKPEDRLLEFRIPAMVLDTGRLMGQIQLYHNLVAWSRGKTHAEASIASFDEIFLPILFQSTIADVVAAGRKIKPECIGNPI